MTPELLRALLVLPSCPRGARELASVTGVHAASRLIQAYGGVELAVPAQTEGRAAAALCRIIHFSALIKLVARYGGDTIYVPACREALRALRMDALRRRFDRLTAGAASISSARAVSLLAREFGLSNRAVERALKMPMSPGAPGLLPPEQGTLF